MAHDGVRVTPAGLNAAIALLFVAGSACFVVGSFPGYLDAVGGVADGVTFFVGSLLEAAGVLSLAAPHLRKHAMHGAAAVGLLGVIGGLVPVILRSARVEEVAVKVGLGMAVLSAVFVGLCVKSFIDVRRARAAAAVAPHATSIR